MATRNPFKEATLTKMFDACVAEARNNFGEFYIVHNRFGGIGPFFPRRGAAHRHAFWNGYNGTQECTVAGSPARAAFRAGQAFRKECGK